MLNESNFIVRISGRRDNSYYIDYLGQYKPTDIAKISGLKVSSIREKFSANGAIWDQELEVYYFNSLENAQKTVADILKDMKEGKKGRTVLLTEDEIEYIRKALINEESNTLHVGRKVKDAIFKKLNG